MWQSVLASNSHELKPLLKYLASELASFADPGGSGGGSDVVRGSQSREVGL